VLQQTVSLHCVVLDALYFLAGQKHGNIYELALQSYKWYLTGLYLPKHHPAFDVNVAYQRAARMAASLHLTEYNNRIVGALHQLIHT
jgi:hypothetical protein